MASQMKLMDEFREQAKRKLKRISMKERNRIIDSVRKFSFDELLRQHLRSVSVSREDYDPDTDSTTEMEDNQVCEMHILKNPINFYILTAHIFLFHSHGSVFVKVLYKSDVCYAIYS